MTDHDAGSEATVPAENPREYRWSLLAAIVLSCATLSSAWCGFQASSWGGVFATCILRWVRAGVPLWGEPVFR